MLFGISNTSMSAAAQDAAGYEQLLALFAEWRAFETPPLLDGAPDYTAARFEQRYAEFQALRARLYAFVIDDWTIPQKVDWHLGAQTLKLLGYRLFKIFF